MSKLDIKRIYIMFFTVIFAILAKLVLDNIFVLKGIPVMIGFVLSPLIGLVASQLIIEKFDYKEVLLFALFMFVSNFILQFIPSLRDLNLFNLQTTTTIGAIGTVIIYLLTIPVSVLASDMITDKGIKLFKGG